MKKKKLVALGMVAAMATTAVIGGSLAYFTDKDSKTNVFTAGNVDIEQHEKDRDGKDFENNQKLFPIVNDAKDDAGYHIGKNYIDKIVTVENKGSEAAYVRTYIAIPEILDDGPETYDAALNVLHWNFGSASDEKSAYLATNANGDRVNANKWYWTKEQFATGNDYPKSTNIANWNDYKTKVGDVTYRVYVATYKDSIKAGETTAPSLMGVYLDKGVDTKKDADGNVIPNEYTVTYEIQNEEIVREFTYDLSNVKILVATEAVQADGFTDINGNGSAADDALDAAFKAVGEHCPFGGTIQ